MDKKNTMLIGAIIFIAVACFVYISLQTTELDTKQAVETASTTLWENAPAEKTSDLLLTSKTVVTAKHAYQNGKHIIAGEVPLPTPCHILDASATASADKKQVLVTLVSSIKTGEVCAQMITPARFKVTVAARKDATMLATLNGQEITLNLIEASAGEDLDNFELYIKG
ncbi:MAG: hypothetical protein A2845_01860 [Candidatus Lloydbacteria bacterium RIFCSPHIGHO2_01_FULL_49_22]|uniref:Uncharacterized protein n=1 Tax=Candidatus Lloydbacteria bacterium RIFCSPHIGHO2_01_FULL_49_22 TaxID=1798658 RepID=A0A1G2CUF9_9BACT|nr:MAG: hypothetical protein A2845_01860 [Candidatus Lloydbacteria bacterium RIFCSPHIGHO2_01_FULL_49_22]OGZ09590.1 MAG: hypothetical protein A3C14_05840 [Candidatus Lloydbacteria bacterium RIFCSPHIGHO2_02_FULL_50_18]